MTITEAARQLAEAIWTDQKLTDAKAYVGMIERTARAIVHDVERYTHEWTHHGKVRWIKDGREHEFKKVK